MFDGIKYLCPFVSKIKRGLTCCRDQEWAGIDTFMFINKVCVNFLVCSVYFQFTVF